MTFQRIDESARTILYIRGSLDALTVHDIRPTVQQIVDNGCDEVVLDLSGLDLIDSSGVGLIVSLFKRLRARGADLRVRGLRDQPLAIFRLLRMDRVFSVSEGAHAPA